MWLNADPSTKLQELGLKILLLGDYGTGKSFFAKSMPEPIFLLDFDGGAIGYAGTRTFVPECFTALRQQPAQLFPAVERELDLVLKHEHPAEKEAGEPFKTIVLDSLTTLTRAAMDYAMLKKPVPPDTPPVWNVHYPLAKVFIDRILDRLRRFDGFVVVIGHLEYQRNDLTGEILAVPALTGKLQTYIPAIFDEVWFTEVAQTKNGKQYLIHLAPSGFKRARSRIRSVVSGIPETIANEWSSISKFLSEPQAQTQEQRKGAPNAGRV